MKVKVVMDDEVLAVGDTIKECIDSLNSGEENGNEWYYVYRDGLIDGYFATTDDVALNDVNGELADVILDVVEVC